MMLVEDNKHGTILMELTDANLIQNNITCIVNEFDLRDASHLEQQRKWTARYSRTGPGDPHPSVAWKYSRKLRTTGKIVQNAWPESGRKLFHMLRRLWEALGSPTETTPGAVGDWVYRKYYDDDEKLSPPPTWIWNAIYDSRRFPRIRNEEEGFFPTVTEYDGNAEFAKRLHQGVPAGHMVYSPRLMRLDKPHAAALIFCDWRWTNPDKKDPGLLFDNRINHNPQGWHTDFAIWEEEWRDAIACGYEIKTHYATVWTKMSYAFADAIEWISGIEVAADQELRAWIKLCRNAGIGRFSMNKLVWKLMTIPDFKAGGGTKVYGDGLWKEIGNEQFVWTKTHGPPRDNLLIHIAHWIWSKTDAIQWATAARLNIPAIRYACDAFMVAGNVDIDIPGYKRTVSTNVRLDSGRNVWSDQGVRWPGKKKATR
jgi:hypothetical protein